MSAFSKLIKGMTLLLLLSLLSGCFMSNPKTETGEYRIDNVRIFQDTPVWELAQAVSRQNTRQIAQIAANNPELLNFQDPLYGTTLLHWAVGTERFNAAEALLKAGADPNIISTRDGGTALYLAAGFSWIDNQAKTDPKFVKLLLEHGADPNIGFVGNHHTMPEIGTTPLMRSIGSGIEKTRALVEAGADINFRTERGVTAAIQALWHGGPNATLDAIMYAHYLIVEKQADITRPWIRTRAGFAEEVAPVNFLRDWIYRLDSEHHRIKMEIVEEFARQGVDYWATEITQHQLNQIKRLYPDSWEEFIKRY